MRLEFDITIKFASREDNIGISVNIFGGEFEIFREFFIKRFGTFKIIHVKYKL